MHIRRAHRRRRSMVGLALVLGLVFAAPSGALASIVMSNYMRGEINPPSVGLELFAYRQGSEHRFDLAAEFDAGVHVDTEVDDSGTFLQLADPAPASGWWDTLWGARRCFEVSNASATALLEHQVRVVFDSSGDVAANLLASDGADYRALADDDATVLDLWVESGVGTATTTVWVQLDLPPMAATGFCLYFDNPSATSVSDQGAVFTYTTPRRLYYPAYWRFDGSGGTNGTLDVVSFVDNNEITVDGLSETRDRGQVATFTGVTEDSIITVTGPIAGRGRGGGMDSIVPVSFAGTTMVFPTNRASQRWTLVTPSGDLADVDIYNGTTLAWTGIVDGIAQFIDADVSNGRSGVIRSVNGVPIIVTHTASDNSFADSQLVPPFFPGDDIYGVRSRQTWIGFDAAGSVDVYRSDGTSETVTGNAGSVTRINDGADFDGNGTAVRFTNMVGATAGIQQADRDGWESTAYLPERLLESEYYLPSDAEYIAFSCPTSMNVVVGGVPVPCTTGNPAYPGHGWHGAAPQGTRIVSDTGERFFAYYEDRQNNDETNLFGMKTAQAVAPQPLAIAGGSLEQLPAAPMTGTWTSPVLDTTSGSSNVFGLLETLASVPAGTDISVQIARGATPAMALVAPFTGPDGTSATSFMAGTEAAPFDWDFGDVFVVVRITLTTTTPGTTPLVDSFRLGFDLPEVSQVSAHAVPYGETDYVLRVWTEDPAMSSATAHMFHLSTTLNGGSAARIGIDTVGQVEVVNGVVNQPSGPSVPIGPGLPHNVIVESTGTILAGWEVVWQATLSGGSILVPHELQLTFS